MTESTTRRLGSKSIRALIEHLLTYTRAELDLMIAAHGLKSRFSGTKPTALNAVFLQLLDEQADADEMGRAIELLEEDVTLPAFGAMQADGYGDPDNKGRAVYKSFRNALRADALDLIEGRVSPFLSPTVNPAKEQSALESRLDDYGFTVARNQLDQATDNAARGNWEAANGQVRSFLEALCNEIAKSTYIESGDAPTGGAARIHLQKIGFLNEKESGLLKALFAVLNGEGAHPGTSSQDDCHRRRLMAFAMANYYLESFGVWSKSG